MSRTAENGQINVLALLERDCLVHSLDLRNDQPCILVLRTRGHPTELRVGGCEIAASLAHSKRAPHTHSISGDAISANECKIYVLADTSTEGLDSADSARVLAVHVSYKY